MNAKSDIKLSKNAKEKRRSEKITNAEKMHRT
jgi:hypothetical protein